MPTSLESSRPIMAPSTRASVRVSTYSMTPSFAPTVQTTDSANGAEFEDISVIKRVMDRLDNKALADQRVSLSDAKTDEMSKITLGAKLERALDRRMSSQDAVMRPRPRTKSTTETEKA